MLIVNYDPVKGWGAPEIKPYGPLVLDPMASCFQYCPNVFEGMKVRSEVPYTFIQCSLSFLAVTTGVRWSRWRASIVQAAEEHGAVDSVRRSSCPSRGSFSPPPYHRKLTHEF